MRGVERPQIDWATVAQSLAQMASNVDDVGEAFFEALEVLELPPAGEAPGVRVRREEGFSIRLARGREIWMASRDGLDPRAFQEALRQVARVMSVGMLPEPRIQPYRWSRPAELEELSQVSLAVERALREAHVAFPVRLFIRRHWRWTQVVGLHLVPEPEMETFYSLQAELPWGCLGALYPTLGDATVKDIVGRLMASFRAREASPPGPCRGAVVLGPPAAAVFLHEGVAHALEVDVLATGGSPAAAVGTRLGGEGLHVLDDPAGAPEGIRRKVDDEGMPVFRRWLLRAGVVEQPLADRLWSRESDRLLPGAARRQNRHLPPGPRSTHLELLAGEAPPEDLLAASPLGLYFPEATQGHLDPVSGDFTLEFPFGWRLRSGEKTEPVGPCRLRGRVADLLQAVAGIGNDCRPAGAGWCAKGGQKLPVWATTPSLLLEGVEVGT